MATTRLYAAAALIALAAAGGGYGIARWTAPPIATTPLTTPPTTPTARAVLYWYDPMMPGQHFDKPSKSPFMDMQLVPRYAETEPGTAGVKIDAATAQGLGMRLARVERGRLAAALTVTGSVDFNLRDTAVVQSRAAGFVERVYGRAQGDIIGIGAPLADVLIPEWAGAQGEYLAVRRIGNPTLTAAARARLRLLGMPDAAIAAVERSGQPRSVTVITAPRGGVITTLDVRQGMTLAAGQTLAQIAGLDRVWLDAAVPDTSIAAVRTGQTVSATFTSLPGERFTGRVAALLPTTQAESRTTTARIELANNRLRLRPGMFASVTLATSDRTVLLVPSEAVIRTGTRILVMRARTGGRYQPTEISIGSEGGGMTEVLAGLAEGDKVVASGQFLLDSEASLSGIVAASPNGGLPEHNQ